MNNSGDGNDANSLVPSATGIRRAAMDWLARREHARCEIETKLHRRFPDATAAIGPVLDQLEHEGLLSDARFVETLVRSRARRGYGPRRIAAELRERGLDTRPGDDDTSPSGITGTAITATGSIDWLAEARRVRARRFGEALPADHDTRQRQMAFLLRRGFSAEICRKACQTVNDDTM